MDLAGDGRLALEEFTSPEVRQVLQQVGGWTNSPWCQWVGPLEDYEEEFRRMGGGGDQVAMAASLAGQVLFPQFVDWALERNLVWDEGK